jgi:cystathionine beta-lyase
LGAVVANETWWPRLRDTSREMGETASPDDLFLAVRGMRTLALRLARHQASALEIARRLSGHPAVKRVLYPALETDPGHALWKRDFAGATGLFAIDLGDVPRESLARFVESLEIFEMGYSWGGYESLIVPAKVRPHDRVVRKWAGGMLVRLSIGLEDPADLYADLEQGLARLG